MAGDKRVRDSFLSYGQQWLDNDDIGEVVKALKSPMLTQGPMIEKFEQATAGYAGTKYAVAFSNGTAALHGAYYAAGISDGDEVITTPMTFAATSNAVLYLGGKPIFSDIDRKTYNLDPVCVEKKLSSKTKAIVSVDFTGQPVDYDSFRTIAEQYNLVYISDGAHSLGASYKGKAVGSQADMTMFSFHPVKPVTAGEGGIIVTNDNVYAEKLRLFRSHGITKENLQQEEGPWFYEMVDLGMNYRLTDLQAALGYSQLKKLDSFITRRKEIASRYSKAFKSLNGIILPLQLDKAESGWHIYVLAFDLSLFKAGRKAMFEALRKENIGVNVHYIPVYKHPYYQKNGYKDVFCENAEQLYEQMLTLPIFPKMSNKDVEDVIAAVKKVVHHYRQ